MMSKGLQDTLLGVKILTCTSEGSTDDSDIDVLGWECTYRKGDDGVYG